MKKSNYILVYTSLFSLVFIPVLHTISCLLSLFILYKVGFPCMYMLRSRHPLPPSCFYHPDSEGSLLPRGSTVLVSGQRVGTVVYFGHCRQQAKDTSSPHRLKASVAPQQQLSLIPSTQEAPSAGSSPQPSCQQLPLLAGPASCNGPLRGDSSPIGVTVILWLPGGSQ